MSKKKEGAESSDFETDQAAKRIMENLPGNEAAEALGGEILYWPTRVSVLNRLIWPDYKPVCIDDRHYIEFYSAAEALYFDVEYDENEQTIMATSEQETIRIDIAQSAIYIDEQAFENEYAPVLLDFGEYTLVLVEVFAALSGLSVVFEEHLGQISITRDSVTEASAQEERWIKAAIEKEMAERYSEADIADIRFISWGSTVVVEVVTHPFEEENGFETIIHARLEIERLFNRDWAVVHKNSSYIKQYPRYKEIIEAENPDVNEEDRAAIVEVLNRYVRAFDEQDAEALVDLLNLEHLFDQGLIKTRTKAIQWACSNFLNQESRYAVSEIKAFKKHENQALVYLSANRPNLREPALDKLIGLTKQEDGKWLIAPYYGDVWKFTERDLLNAYERNLYINQHIEQRNRAERQ